MIRLRLNLIILNVLSLLNHDFLMIACQFRLELCIENVCHFAKLTCILFSIYSNTKNLIFSLVHYNCKIILQWILSHQGNCLGANYAICAAEITKSFNVSRPKTNFRLFAHINLTEYLGVKRGDKILWHLRHREEK